MKKVLLVSMILFVGISLMSGCHSGTTRGIGSDISKLGNHMQK